MRIDGPPNQRDVHSTKGGPGIHVRRVVDSDETYDCVIVGAGASGLAAAKYYRDRFGEDSRILLLDPLPDFGGHSARNEFHVGDTTFLKNGGTVNLDSVGDVEPPTGGLLDIPGSYGQPAWTCSPTSASTRTASPSRTSTNPPISVCARCCCSRPRDWGADTLVPEPEVARAVAGVPRQTPFSPEARAAITRIETERTTDWLEAQGRPTQRSGEEGDPLPDHAEAVLHGLQRGPGEAIV